MEQYKYAYNRLMRYGFTTGTCAAAASKAAAAALLTGYSADSVKIVVPKGVELDIAIEDTVIKDGMCTLSLIHISVIIGEDYSIGVCGTGEDHGRVREVAGKIRDEYGVKKEDA